VQSGQCTAVLEGHSQRPSSDLPEKVVRRGGFYGYRVCSLTSLSQNIFVSGGVDGVIKVWDIAHAQCIQVMRDDTHSFNRHLYPLDEHRILAGHGGAVKIWDVQTGKCLKTLKIIYSDQLLCVPEKNLLIAHHCNRIRIYELDSEKCLHTMDVGMTLVSETNFYVGAYLLPCPGVTSFQLHRDGTLISTLGNDIIMRWDIDNEKCTQIIVDGAPHDAPHMRGVQMQCAPLLEDNKYVTGGIDGKIRFWNLDIKKEEQAFPAETEENNTSPADEDAILKAKLVELEETLRKEQEIAEAQRQRMEAIRKASEEKETRTHDLIKKTRQLESALKKDDKSYHAELEQAQHELEAMKQQYQDVWVQWQKMLEMVNQSLQQEQRNLQEREAMLQEEMAQLAEEQEHLQLEKAALQKEKQRLTEEPAKKGDMDKELRNKLEALQEQEEALAKREKTLIAREKSLTELKGKNASLKEVISERKLALEQAQASFAEVKKQLEAFALENKTTATEDATQATPEQMAQLKRRHKMLMRENEQLKKNIQVSQERVKNLEEALTAQQREEAAIKIQASWRGFWVRKEQPLSKLSEERRKVVQTHMKQCVEESRYEELAQMAQLVKAERWHEAMQRIRGLAEIAEMPPVENNQTANPESKEPERPAPVPTMTNRKGDCVIG
jgi:hypothetical protein